MTSRLNRPALPLAVGLAAWISSAVFHAQQPAVAPAPQVTTAAPAAPLPAVDVTAAEITSFINALPRGAISDRPIRAADVGGYGITVFGVFRPKSLAGDAILHQTRTSEIYYMLKGAGTLVTGGRLMDLKENNTRGARIEGGVTRRVTPGDVVIIPGRTPHWWSSLESDIEYLIFRPNPDARSGAK
jgi:mannose-6-phosphate isomerase-like protein (cupin superfamily)